MAERSEAKSAKKRKNEKARIFHDFVKNRLLVVLRFGNC